MQTVTKYKDRQKRAWPLSFSTRTEIGRKVRGHKSIELDEPSTVESDQKENANEKTTSAADNRTVGVPVARGKKRKESGEYPGAGARIHGVRGRTRKMVMLKKYMKSLKNTTRAHALHGTETSSLGIKSYAELAPFLAKEVERVMATLLENTPDELKITPESICELHKDAFKNLCLHGQAAIEIEM